MNPILFYTRKTLVLLTLMLAAFYGRAQWFMSSGGTSQYTPCYEFPNIKKLNSTFTWRDALQTRTNARQGVSQNIILDPLVFDAIITDDSGGVFDDNNFFELNTRFPDNDQSLRYAMTWAVQLFDTLLDVNTLRGYPYDSTTVHLDSLDFVIAHANVTGTNDTIVFTIYAAQNPLGIQINAQERIANPILFSDTVITSSSLSPAGQYSLYTIYPDIDLNGNKKFIAGVHFYGDTSNTFGLRVGYADRCEGSCAAYPSINRDKTFYRMVHWQQPVGMALQDLTGVYSNYSSSLSYDCNQNLQFDQGACEIFFIQNFWMTAHITIGANSNVCIPSVANGTPGVFPSPDNIPCIERGVPYDFTMQLENFTVLPLIDTLYYSRIDSIKNLPCGITWQSNKLQYAAGETGCIRVSGTTLEPAGQYPLRIFMTMNVYIAAIGAGDISGEINNSNLSVYNFDTLGVDMDYYSRVIEPGNPCPSIERCITENNLANCNGDYINNGNYGYCGQAILNANNVKAWFTANGSFFTNGFQPGFVVPKSGAASTIYGSGLWLGGIDAAGALHLAAQTYNSDYWSGPLDANGAIDSTTKNQWDRIWKVTRSQINQHKADYNDDGTFSSPIPSIFEWPGKGNFYARGGGSVGLSVVQDAAPFIDKNSNGTYEPYLGEYPDINGDEMIWYVMNDNFSAHTESGGLPLGVEIQVSAYEYSSQDEIVNNTVFVHLKVINKSTTSYHSVYLGNFVDFDIGCGSNDYAGCDSTVNSFFAYNATATDAICALGYGNDPPIQSVTFLDRDLSSFLSYNNDVTVLGNPDDSTDYYYYLTSRWKNGTPIVEGGNGYGTGNATSFMYPGNPSDSLEWSECSVNSLPGDRRGVGATGPFNLPSGGSTEITVAYTTHFAQGSLPCPDISTVSQAIDSLTTLFTNGELDSVNISGQIKTEINTAIAGVTVNLTGSVSLAETTTVDGMYSFAVSSKDSFNVTPSKSNDIATNNGITTLDILLIRRHILNVALLSSPYKIISADVNGNSSVSTQDILLMRQLILNITSTFPNGRLWAFVPDDYQFPDILQPWLAPSSRSYTNISSDLTKQDFIGIKLGDVNNDWNPNTPKFGAVGELHFQMEAQNTLPWQEIAIPVKVKDFKSVSGYQFTLSWDTSVLSLLEVTNKAIQGYYGEHRKDEGYLTTTWYDEMTNAVTLDDDAVAFELKFKVIGANGNFSTITIGSELTASEAYNENLDLLNIVPQNGMVKVGDANSFVTRNSSFVTLSVQPNPFTNTTNIIFTVPQDETVTLSIYDILGREVKYMKADYKAGEHRVEWGGDDGHGNQLSKGLYHIRMIAGNYTTGEKVVLVR